jgi:uncharacterized protein (DUF488 family)
VKNRDTINVFTIGHSTRTVENFIGLLKENNVSLVIDIRTIPRSRHNPQFNSDTLTDTLNKAGVSYQHVAGLGGLRHAHPKLAESGLA